MDQLFVDLFGKPALKPAKIITVVAENFPLIQDRAKFLRTVLAIPDVKQLALQNVSKRLIQIGPIHSDIERMISQDDKWSVNSYIGDNDATSLCDRIANDFPDTSCAAHRSLIFVNDASKLLLLAHDDRSESLKFLKMIDKWKRCKNNFVVILFQQSSPPPKSKFLQDLVNISDACVTNRSFKACYGQSIWFHPSPIQKALIPPQVETQYYTVKIGESSSPRKLPCFQDSLRVNKNHDPESGAGVMASSDKVHEKMDSTPEKTLEKLTLDEDEDKSATATSTLPYIRAQNPEQSRIFYYPDKDDDFDEDDPDEDLDI